MQVTITAWVHYRRGFIDGASVYELYPFSIPVGDSIPLHSMEVLIEIPDTLTPEQLKEKEIERLSQQIEEEKKRHKDTYNALRNRITVIEGK